MKKFKYITIALKTLSVSAIAVILYQVIIAFPELPDQIEKHWDMQGNADQWGSKYNFLTIPIISIAIYLIFTISIKVESKKYKHLKSYPLFEVYIRLLLAVILAFLTFHIYLQSYKYIHGESLVEDFSIIYAMITIMFVTILVVRQGIKINNDQNA
jgi:uncharacterized membrane protein